MGSLPCLLLKCSSPRFLHGSLLSIDGSGLRVASGPGHLPVCPKTQPPAVPALLCITGAWGRGGGRRFPGGSAHWFLVVLSPWEVLAADRRAGEREKPGCLQQAPASVSGRVSSSRPHQPALPSDPGVASPSVCPSCLSSTFVKFSVLKSYRTTGCGTCFPSGSEFNIEC